MISILIGTDDCFYCFLVTTYFFFLSHCFIYPNRNVCAKVGFSLISLDLLGFFVCQGQKLIIVGMN